MRKLIMIPVLAVFGAIAPTTAAFAATRNPTTPAANRCDGAIRNHDGSPATWSCRSTGRNPGRPHVVTIMPTGKTIVRATPVVPTVTGTVIRIRYSH